MKQTTTEFILFTAFTLLLGFFVGWVCFSPTLSPSSERISEQQYGEQSLQYLEDIRNSNDLILLELTK